MVPVVAIVGIMLSTWDAPSRLPSLVCGVGAYVCLVLFWALCVRKGVRVHCDLVADCEVSVTSQAYDRARSAGDTRSHNSVLPCCTLLLGVTGAAFALISPCNTPMTGSDCAPPRWTWRGFGVSTQRQVAVAIDHRGVLVNGGAGVVDVAGRKALLYVTRFGYPCFAFQQGWA